jgi:hypothetical protein
MTEEAKFAIRDRRQPGWFYIDNEIIDKYGRHLDAYGVAVYAVLCRHCRNSTQQVTNLSQRDIAATLGISQDRVRKSLNTLVEFFLIAVDIPQRPCPGIISTITLLSVKATERHTFSSSDELNATRSRNKEDKTKTKTKLPPTPLFEGGIFTTWQSANLYLKDGLASAYVHNPHFQEDCYEKYFRDAWLVEISDGIAILDSQNSTLLEHGVEQFQRRLLDAFRRAGVELSAVQVKQSQSRTLEASA